MNLFFFSFNFKIFSSVPGRVRLKIASGISARLNPGCRMSIEFLDKAEIRSREVATKVDVWKPGSP